MKKACLLMLFGLLICGTFTLSGISGVKKAEWHTTMMSCDPKCYKPVSALARIVDTTKYDFHFEFKAVTPGTIPGVHDLVIIGSLLVTGEMISTSDSGIKPKIDLTALASGWADGTKNPIDWAGDTFTLTKVNNKHYILDYNDFRIKPGTTGNVEIWLYVESKDKRGVYYSERKRLLIKPCLGTHTPMK